MIHGTNTAQSLQKNETSPAFIERYVPGTVLSPSSVLIHLILTKTQEKDTFSNIIPVLQVKKLRQLAQVHT